MFKDSQLWHNRKINQVERFLEQVSKQTFQNFELHALIGKSSDSTEKDLFSLKDSRTFLYKENKEYSSKVISNLIRIKDSSRAANYLLDKVRNKASEYFWIESDLIFDEFLLEKLLEGRKFFDIIAPMVILEKHDIFYDIWGFLDKNNISVGNKFHKKNLEKYTQLHSVGSVTVINGNIINKGINFGDNGFRNLCQQALSYNAKIAVDSTQTVVHPGKEHIEERWI